MAQTLVKPSTIIQSQVINLPPVDQYMIRIYIPIILCFPLGPENSPRQVYSELRCGLSDALVDFPFMAGRIVKHDAARDRIQIQLSTDGGVVFKYNDLTSSESSSPDFHDLEQAHFPPSEFDESLTPGVPLFPTGSKLPILLLQANFIKGGLLLVAYFHHAASDVVGWTGFTRSWAKNTSAASRGARLAPRPSFEALDRSPLFRVDNNLTLEQCEQLVKVEEVAGHTNMIGDVLNRPLQKATRSNKVCAIWYFSADNLRALKAAAQPVQTATADSWVSTNDSLCALFWRHCSRASHLKESGYTTAKFQIPVNVRSRLSLNPDYVGNAVMPALFSYPIQELYSTVPDSLHLTARAIRKAINRIDESQVRSLWGVIDSLPTMNSARYNFASPPDFLITTFAEHDWYGFDWGSHMGRLTGFRFPATIAAGVIAILPKPSDGGLEVCMVLEAEVVERLRLDETFMSFAELRCC